MSYLLTALTFSLSLALSVRPPSTAAVAYDLTEFHVEDGLIHFKDGSQPIDPSVYGKVRFVENKKGVIVEAKKSNQLLLMKQIGEKQGYDQIISLEMRCFYVPVDRLPEIGIEKEQIDLSQTPILRRHGSQSDLPLYENPTAAFEISPEQLKTFRRMFTGKAGGELGRESHQMLAGKKVMVSTECDEIDHENGAIEITDERTVISQEPFAISDSYPQYDIITTMDSNGGDTHIEFTVRTGNLDTESLSEMFVSRRIKLGNSILFVDLTTILDLSDEGFQLSPNGEVPGFKPPKDEGKRRVFILTPSLIRQ